MAYPFSPRSVQLPSQARFNVAEFEPLLDSNEACCASSHASQNTSEVSSPRRDQGSHVRKPWLFRVSDLNEWLWRQERAG